MTLLRDKPDLPAYYAAAGYQLGKELAAVDAWAGRMRDPATLHVPEGAHPAYGPALRRGYADNITAADPIAGALSEAI